jgi:hypothetical protein
MRDQPPSTLLAQTNGEAGGGVEDVQQRMAIRDGVTRGDPQVRYFERSCTATVVGEEQFPGLPVLAIPRDCSGSGTSNITMSSVWCATAASMSLARTAAAQRSTNSRIWCSLLVSGMVISLTTAARAMATNTVASSRPGLSR